MSKTVRIILLSILILLLIAIRLFLQPYFYDPLLVFFKHDYLHLEIPKLDYGRYFVNIFYRYLLNTGLSLGILFLIFKSKNVLKFSVKFYIGAFIIFGLLLYVELKFTIINNYNVVFYVRRFLIQPLFLLLLIPAFYYQKIRVDKID